MFLINWGELTSRWDPTYVNFQEKLVVGFKFPIVKFKDLLRESPFYGANEPGNIRESNEQIRYVRITDIDDDGRLTTCLGATCSLVESKYLLQDMDLLIARSGNTVGKSYLHDVKSVSDKCIFGGYLINFRIDSNLVLPYYVFYYLQCKFFKEWKNATMRFAGQPNINAQEYKNMPITLPDIRTQQSIVSIMNEAYEQKCQKEQEAQLLLNNISDYIIGALGIKLPLEANQDLSDRIFYIHATDMLGGRFDPRKYSRKYKQLLDAIESAPYVRLMLKEIVLNDVSGDWGVDDTIEDPDLISCLTIRGTEFDNKFNLDLDNNRTKFRKYSKASFDKIALKEKDILIEKSGGSEDQPVGRVAFIEKDMLDKYSLAFSNFIHRIRIDENKAVPEYVFEYLRLMHNIKITEVMQTQTNGIRNLIIQEYFGQTILLPDRKKQEEIAFHAAQMRKRAFELQEEAEKIVLDAKAKVEKMLLGDEQ